MPATSPRRAPSSETAFSVNWTGTGVAPGAQIALSDGSLGSASRLVFESLYGANDLWLTNGSAQVLKDNAPDTSVGSGSPWHGTPAAWQGVLDSLGFTVIGMGFSVGSGVLSDGTLTEVTAGCHTMLFDATSIPPGDPTCVSSGTTTIHSVGEFGYSDIGTSGHIEFQPGQAHVFTDDTTSEALVAGYIAAPGTKLGTRSVSTGPALVWHPAPRSHSATEHSAADRSSCSRPSTAATICG